MSSSGLGLHNGIRKRRRKALSCYECRRRKVKCDRGTPSCNRCKETGQASSCSYTLDDPGRGYDDERSESPDESLVGHQRSRQVSSSTVNVPDEILSVLKQQSRKIAQLEAKLVGSGPPQSREWKGLEQVIAGPRPDTEESSKSKMEIFVENQGPKDPEQIPVRGGKGFETKFYGASNSTSLIIYFPELRSFIQESLQANSSLARLQRSLQSQGDHRRSLKTKPLVSNDYLLTLLPSKDLVDRLAKEYFENFETTYRVLHEPSFYNEYNIFWQQPQKGTGSFTVILLLISAMASCLHSDPASKGLDEAKSARDIWVSWIEACDSWLDLQSQKHLNLANFQVRCLLLLSKQMMMVKEKRAWTLATTLLSFSISAGLHRDPSLLSGRISIFEQEMRRRLWGTIVEIEIEASIDRGVRSFTTDLPYDCPPPSNLEDNDFGVEAEQLPKQRPSSSFTPSSFLCRLHKSRSYRTSLISLINNPNSNLPYDEMMIHDGKILQSIKELARWENIDRAYSQLSKVPLALIDIQFRQLLLLLHSPWARKAESNPRYNYSRMMCLSTAKYMLDQYTALTNSGSYALILARNDVIRAALSFCHNFFISRIVRDDISSLILAYSVFPLIESAISMMEDRVNRIERGYKNYIFISMAYGLLLSQECPEQSGKYKTEAVDRVTRLYAKILSATGELRFLPMLDNQPLPVELGTVIPSSPFPMTHSVNTILEANDIPFEPFDFGDLSDWPLDDIWPPEFEASYAIPWQFSVN